MDFTLNDEQRQIYEYGGAGLGMTEMALFMEGTIAKQNWMSPRQAAGSSSFLWNSLPWLAIWASDMVGPTTIIKSGMP